MIRFLCLLLGALTAFLGAGCLLLFIWEGLFGRGPDGVLFKGALSFAFISACMMWYWNSSRPRNYSY